MRAEAKTVDNSVKAAVLLLLAMLLIAVSVSDAFAARLQAAQLLRICLDELHRHLLPAVVKLLPALKHAATGAFATALWCAWFVSD